MSFDIMTGREPLKVQVFDRADIGRDGLIGEATIALESLKDQYKHDDWFDLKGPKGVTGKIRVNLHWIHSRKKFL